MEPERSGRYMVTSKPFFSPNKTSTVSEKPNQFRSGRGYVKSVSTLLCTLMFVVSYIADYDFTLRTYDDDVMD